MINNLINKKCQMSFFTINLEKVENFPKSNDYVCKIFHKDNCKKFLFSIENNLVIIARNAGYIGFKLDEATRLADEKINIVFYERSKVKTSKIFSKIIGKYEMLLEGLKASNPLVIEDNLVDESTNSLLPQRIKFVITYVGIINFDEETFKVKMDEYERPDTTNFGNVIVATALKRNYPQNEETSEENSPEKLFEGSLSVIYNEKFLAEMREWNINVKIIKLKYLTSFEENTNYYCYVNIGDKVFRTDVKPVDNLIFNEVFSCKITGVETENVLNTLIKITVYYKKDLFYNIASIGCNCLGTFVVDLGTVYKQRNHEYHQKWAGIRSENESGNEVLFKAYLKCSINVQSTGDTFTSHREKVFLQQIEDSKNEIMNNLIYPIDSSEKSYSYLNLYIRPRQADLLDKYDSSFFNIELIKNTLFNTNSIEDIENQSQNENEDYSYLNPFIQITYADKVLRTRTITNSKRPKWNQDNALKLKIMYPPLVRCLKIELCSQEWLGVRVLGTENIYLEDISNSFDTNLLPTLGPTYIYLYTQTFLSSYTREPIMAQELRDQHGRTSADIHRRRQNESPISSSSLDNTFSLINNERNKVNKYMGRVQMEIFSEKSMKTSMLAPPIEFNEFSKSPYRDNDYVLFACIYDTTMIDNSLQGKNLSFKLTIGPFGHEHNTTENQTKKSKPERRAPDSPLYLRTEKMKPCLFLSFRIEDKANVLFKMNFINKKSQELLNYFEALKNKSTMNNVEFENFIFDCSSFIKQVEVYLKSYEHTRMTILNKNRLLKIRQSITTISHKLDILKKLRMDELRYFVTSGWKYIEYEIESLINTSNEVYFFFPDADLWLLSDDEPVGLMSFRACDIVRSNNENEKGIFCEKIVSKFVKSLRPGDLKDINKQNIARVKVFFWLGLKNEKELIVPAMPKGFLNYEMSKELALPRYIHFPAPMKFTLYAHIYQGCDLMGLDSTGLSDPYLCVTLDNRTVGTMTKNETNNPRWEETLTIKDVYLYGTFESIQKNPPELIVEIYDSDFHVNLANEYLNELSNKLYQLQRKEFMGRCYIKPCVVEAHQSTPKLRWHRVYYGDKNAGEILASFELRTSDQTQENFINRRINIQESVAPSTCTYRFEVLFWGLRDVKSFLVGEQSHFKIKVELGTEKLISMINLDGKSNGNFGISFFRSDILLAEEDLYKPSIVITCIRTGTGLPSKGQIVGSYTCRSSAIFVKNFEELVKKYQDYENVFDNTKLQSKSYGRSFSFLKEPDSPTDSANQEKPNLEAIELANQDISDSTNMHEWLNNDMNWWKRFNYSSNIGQFITMKQERNANIMQDIKINQDYLNANPNYLAEFDENNDEDYDDDTNEEPDEDNEEEDSNETGRFLSKISLFNKKNKYPKIYDDSKVFTDPIKIYNCELENVDEIKDCFTELVDSYQLQSGKHIDKNREVQCIFKGKFLIYKQDQTTDSKFKKIMTQSGGFLGINTRNATMSYRIRVYIIRAEISNLVDIRSQFEPYIVLKCGDKVIDDSVRRLPYNPEHTYDFGRVFEFDARFPHDAKLTISFMEHGVGLRSPNEIGKTEIDLENRCFARCHATLGLQKTYETKGYNAWRNSLLPYEILKNMSSLWNFKKMKYNDLTTSIDIIDMSDKQYTFKWKNSTDLNVVKIKRACINNEDIKQQLSLDVLNSWKAITGQELVPEHVESRALLKKGASEIVQGTVQMWIDMFPEKQGKIPPKPVNVELPKPVKLQLRIIIKNTKDVYLDDTNLITGERTSDIYVKGWIGDQLDRYQQTDTHYRSNTGEGNFNWRFVFNFVYMPGRHKILSEDQKLFSFMNKQTKEVDPILTLQVWDADYVSRDDFIGEIKLNLLKFTRGTKSAKMCSSTKAERLKTNLFKTRKAVGWWALRNGPELRGRLEAHFQLLTEAEAAKDPAGKGRDPPQALEVPKRPEDSYLWFLSPIKSFKYEIWRNHKCLIFKLFAIIIAILVIVIIFVQTPSLLVRRLLGL